MSTKPKPKPITIVADNQQSVVIDVIFKKTALNPDTLEYVSIFFSQQCTLSIIKSKRFRGMWLCKLSNGKVFLKGLTSCTELDLVEYSCEAVDVTFSKANKITTEEARDLVSKGARYFNSEDFAYEGEYLGHFDK